MRIVQVCPTYYPHIGGTEDHVKNISERLAKRHDVTVFTTDPSSELRKEESMNGVKIRRYQAFAPSEAYHFSSDMLRALRTAEFDIVHGHDFHSFPLFFSRYAKCRLYVVTPHYHGAGHTPLRSLLMRLYKSVGGRALRDADEIICVSDYEKSLIVNHFKIGDEKISVIPNGITLEDFQGLEKRRKDCRVILCVSRMEKYKGLHYLIKAVPKLQNDIILQIIGKGPYKKALVKLTERLNVENRVKFYQDLPREELLQKYADADLFVLLSRYEAFGITVAEALALKTPCIVANTSALREWVDNENCFGIDYPIGSEELVKLVNEVIGKEVKEVKEVKLLDWDDVVKRLIEVYGGNS